MADRQREGLEPAGQQAGPGPAPAATPRVRPARTGRHGLGRQRVGRRGVPRPCCPQGLMGRHLLGNAGPGWLRLAGPSGRQHAFPQFPVWATDVARGRQLSRSAAAISGPFSGRQPSQKDSVPPSLLTHPVSPMATPLTQGSAGALLRKKQGPWPEPGMVGGEGWCATHSKAVYLMSRSNKSLAVT